MDVLTLVGTALALGAILGGNLLEGGHTGSLMQLTAFVIVAGGTVGAVMVQTPLPIFLRSLKMARWVILPPKLAQTEAIEKIVNWSNIARKGLQLLVDGSEPDTIRGILEVELDSIEHADTQGAKAPEGMGGYSPTIGIIGAVMGLIHVMNNLADPSKLSESIAVAFVETKYGVGLANIFFLPIANKLKSYIHKQSKFREMIIEGIISMAFFFFCFCCCF